MRIGSVVFGVQVAMVLAFSLTQGCITTGSDKNRTVFKNKGPFEHVHPGKTGEEETTFQGTPGQGDGWDINDSAGFYQPTGGGITSVQTIPPPDWNSFNTQPTTETYIVQKGDVLSKLAVKFDTTTAELVRLNGLAYPDVLYVGQELRVPAGRGASSSATSRTSSGGASSGGITYEIRKGDTLSQIAVAAGVGIDDIRRLNHIDGDKIMAGEILYLPAGAKVPSTARSSSTSTTRTTTASTNASAKTGADATLVVPGIAGVPGEGTTLVPEGTTPAAGQYFFDHMVYQNDTLDSIAREYGVSKAEIMSLNALSSESDMKQGMTLRIPSLD